MLLFCVLVLMATFGKGHFYVLGTSETEASEAITSAEENIAICYDAIVKADAVNADVSGLVDTLNEAGEFLSKAELAYALGNFDSAFSYATQAEAELDGFVGSAEDLTDTTSRENQLNFLFTVGGSSVACLLVVIGGVFVWRWGSRNYGRRVPA